jgi:3',5'-cyclic AMP phosphodiesterase CpdA
MVRRKRMTEFRGIVGALAVQNIRFMPGEHDASLDAGAAFKEQFGDTFYAFDHKGIHFVALDNVSDPHAALGDAQCRWLEEHLAAYDPTTPIVVFTHRPLFDLYPSWDWATADGAKAIAILQRYPNVTVFYGHIHQEHHMMTGNIAHHAARSLIFPQPAPGSVAVKAPVPWDDAHPYEGLGWRAVDAKLPTSFDLQEHPVKEA